MTISQIKKNMKHGDYNILQKLLKLSTESAARQKFLRGDKDAVEGMIKIQENRSIFCDLHADEDCSCHDDLKGAINQKADINHTHDWNEITGKPTEFPPTHHSHNIRDIEELDDLLHNVDDLRNLSNQKLDRDGSNATGSLASTIANNHMHSNKAILDTVTASKVNDWDNAASKTHNAVTLGSNATGLTITNQVLQFSNGYQLPTTIKVNEWDDAYLKRHTHSNKAVLDNLTQSVIDQTHVHSNKSVIDGITAQMVNNWNGSFANNHTHNNKSTLDGISAADVTNWDTAHANNHTHTNKVILDAITAAYTVAEKDKLATVQPNAQVNVKADWNATSGDAEILNKPTSFNPKSHNHTISDVAGLQIELDSKLETPHLNGFVHDVAYNSSLHTITFYQRNEPNIVIDLPIEHLIKGVQLHGNDLVFTFEDGSNVTIPMNTLLVGVVKSVNGLVANSQGEVVLDITDIPGLQSALNAKANTSGYYSGLSVGDSTLWAGQRYVELGTNGNISHFMTFDPDNNIWRKASISHTQNTLGINTALNLNLQQVTNNGNITTNQIVVKNTGYDDYTIIAGQDFRFLTSGGSALKILTGGVLTSDSYSDASLVPINGGYFKGTVATLNHLSSLEWATAYNIAIALQNTQGNYVSKLNVNENVDGQKRFIGGYTDWVLNNDDVTNGRGFVQSFPNAFLTGTLNDADYILYRNGLQHVYLQSNRTLFSLPVESSQFVANSGGLIVRGNGGVNSNTTKMFFENNTASIGWAISQGVNGVTQEGLSFGTWDGSTFTNKMFLEPVGNLNLYANIVTSNYGSADLWNQGYLNSQTALSLSWNDTLLNNPVTTSLPIFNRGQGQKFILKSQSAVGDNYFSFFNNAGSETHYLGLGSTGNDNFAFVSTANTSFNFYANNNHILQIQDGYIEAYRDLYVSNGGTIHTSNAGNSDQWYRAYTWGILRDSSVGLNNASGIGSNNGMVQKYWFDYNWANMGYAGSTISFGGFSGSYQTEIFGEYGNGGNRLGFRTRNDDVNQWNPSRWLWHDGNFDPDGKANVFGSNLQNIPNWQSVLGITGLGTNKANIDGTNLTNIANWRSVLNIPTDNNQLGNGAGYITAANLPNVSNATITYQGTGAITGGGSHTINQSGNSTYNFDLTNQTKNEISLGVIAYNSLSSKQDTLIAGSGISIVGNTISATGSSGGAGGIERIFTDNSQQSGPTASNMPLLFTSHEAYGKPETQIDDQEYGNLTMKVETGDVVRFYGSLDNVFTDIQPTGSTYYLDIDGLRKHIYNIIFQSSGGVGGTVRFDKGIYTGDQINITVPKGQQIVMQSTANIVSSYGSGGGVEVLTHANLIWDAKLDSWILVSYD